MTCSCPLALSGPGGSVRLEVHALNFGHLWWQSLQCVPRRTLSPHTALQLARSRAGRPSASRLPPRPAGVDLVPFALCAAFPRAPVGRHAHDYYGTSVALGLAPGRPSRLPAIIDVRARRRCPVRPLLRGHASPPTRRRVRASAVSARYPGGPASDALRGMRAASLGTGVQAIRLSPYHAGLASPGHTHSSGRSRFPTMLLSPSAFTSRSGG